MTTTQTLSMYRDGGDYVFLTDGVECARLTVWYPAYRAPVFIGGEWREVKK